MFTIFGFIILLSPRIYIFSGERQINKQIREVKHICRMISFMEKYKPRQRHRDGWGSGSKRATDKEPFE